MVAGRDQTYLCACLMQFHRQPSGGRQLAGRGQQNMRIVHHLPLRAGSDVRDVDSVFHECARLESGRQLRRCETHGFAVIDE